MISPSHVTFGKGDPDANMALPSVHLCAASAEHSALLVGLDSGKMTGAPGQFSFIVRKTSSKDWY